MVDSDTNGGADAGSNADDDSSGALTAVIRVLRPLSSEDRHRTVGAAMVFLGETATLKFVGGDAGATGVGAGDTGGDYAPAAIKWMEQNQISAEELDMVFQFKGDGTFEIHDAPGKSKKEKTLNTYVLTGLGAYIVKGGRNFTDSMARAYCETLGCLDRPNHATYLKEKGNEFSGDKTNGYALSNPGVRRGATLVKELASRAK